MSLKVVTVRIATFVIIVTSRCMLLKVVTVRIATFVIIVRPLLFQRNPVYKYRFSSKLHLTNSKRYFYISVGAYQSLTYSNALSLFEYNRHQRLKNTDRFYYLNASYGKIHNGTKHHTSYHVTLYIQRQNLQDSMREYHSFNDEIS